MKKGVILENNFLNEIIFRIDFTTILEISGDKKEAADKFRKRIFDNFPNVEILHQKNVSVDIDVKSGYPKKITNDGNLCWIFRNEECNKEVSLTANNLVLNYHYGEYKGFKDFLEEILILLNALDEYGPFKLNFLGLRYVNEIYYEEINNNIGLYINKSLFNTSILDDLKKENSQLIQLFSKLDFKKEDYNLTLQYGFFNPTNNPDGEKHFILDYDCVNREISEIEDVKDNLKIMNHLIFETFEYSITDELIEKMGENYGN